LDAFRDLEEGYYYFSFALIGDIRLLKKIISIRHYLSILWIIMVFILVIGWPIEAFVPYTVLVDANKITIQHFFKTQINIRDVKVITERISTEWTLQTLR